MTNPVHAEPGIRVYEGQLSLRCYGEIENMLYLSSIKDPLLEGLECMCGRSVTVRYWITSKQCTMEEAQTLTAMTALGLIDVEFEHHYSEHTGYLWTDEKLVVGGHDLLRELQSGAGKWLIMEVAIHRSYEHTP